MDHKYAKLTGIPGIERRSVFHALNQKAVARRCAKDMGLPYENARFIVAHMGGGITVGAHRYGRVIDVNDALAGEGPFTPERSGGVPAVALIRMCYSGAFTEQEMVDRVSRAGGMQAYLGTNDLRKCERLIKEGDAYAALVLESMAYQVSKEIGAMVAVLEGRVDAIILTGGLTYSDRFTGCIKQRVSLIAPVMAAWERTRCSRWRRARCGCCAASGRLSNIRATPYGSCAIVLADPARLLVKRGQKPRAIQKGNPDWFFRCGRNDGTTGLLPVSARALRSSWASSFHKGVYLPEPRVKIINDSIYRVKWQNSHTRRQRTSSRLVLLSEQVKSVSSALPPATESAAMSSGVTVWSACDAVVGVRLPVLREGGRGRSGFQVFKPCESVRR